MGAVGSRLRLVAYSDCAEQEMTLQDLQSDDLVSLPSLRSSDPLPRAAPP